MRTDEDFRILVGCVLTVYAVRVRKVQGVNARSFKAAKEAIVSFAATTTPWAVRGTAGDRRWSRGPLHQDEAFGGRPSEGTVERVGRLSSRLRGEQQKRFCPSCGAEEPKAIFRTRNGIACPSCANRGKPVQQPATAVEPTALQAVLEEA